jgi:hypothetical protein
MRMVIPFVDELSDLRIEVGFGCKDELALVETPAARDLDAQTAPRHP